MLSLLDRVAATDIELLLHGETGVGKEQYARYAHERSARADAPFVAVNCGSIPADLFENELFGHVAGAFTGARPRSTGLVGIAEGGTLFLDEVDALALANQVKLLRLLQEKEYRRLGEARAQQADVRIMAATNRDLVQASRDGAFRDDLLFRLKVVSLAVPPLRDRSDDVLPLLDAFSDWYAKEYRVDSILFTPAARARLKAYSWPGNVRELENLVRSLTCIHHSRVVEAEDLPIDVPSTSTTGNGTAPGGSFHEAKAAVVNDFERRFLEDALTASSGNIAHAARAVGKPRRAFFELMRKHGVTARR